MHPSVTLFHPVKATFQEADKDNSGALDAAELAVIIKAYYKREGVSKSLAKSTAEIESMISEFDGLFDGIRTGTLNFAEFLHMYAKGSHFKFQTPPETRGKILILELQRRRKGLDPTTRLKANLLRNCGEILLSFKITAKRRSLTQWKHNRIRDGFKFFRQKAARLQARLQTQFGLTPPGTPCSWNQPLSSPGSMLMGSDRRHKGSIDKELSDSTSSILRNSSVESELAHKDAMLNSQMLRLALQNEANVSSHTTNYLLTPIDTPREVESLHTPLSQHSSELEEEEGNNLTPKSIRDGACGHNIITIIGEDPTSTIPPG